MNRKITSLQSQYRLLQQGISLLQSHPIQLPVMYPQMKIWQPILVTLRAVHAKTQSLTLRVASPLLEREPFPIEVAKFPVKHSAITQNPINALVSSQSLRKGNFPSAQTYHTPLLLQQSWPITSNSSLQT